MINKREQGMTLVVLVVTIIILLILAGVAINMALGDNGLFKKSKEAVNVWKSAESNEAGVLGYLDSLINGGNGSNVGDSQKPQGPVITGDNVDDIVLPVDTEVPTTVTIGGEEVIVPPKFTIAKDSGKTVLEGIVVVDPQGNEWVWVPCYVPEGKGSNISGQIEYARYAFESQVLSKSDNKIYPQASYYSHWYYEKQPLTETSSEYQSIKQYGGYYIARYEAGDKESTEAGIMRGETGSSIGNSTKGDATHTVTIKKDQVPYNYVTQAQCVTLSEGMTSEDGTDANKLNGTQVFTKLCSSYSWDTAIKFMEKTYPTYGNTKETKNGIVVYGTKFLNTGDSFSICSIYDMQGNLEEYTTESYTYYPQICCSRGGSYLFGGSTNVFPAGHRSAPNGVGTNYMGFRPTLFIKAV